MNDDDYATSSASELASSLASRTVSAAELCEAAIARIERLDPPINAVVVRDFDRARDAAALADAALARGERRPLLGVPMTVKEAHNVAGLPTTWGLEAHRDWIAPTDSVAVARLKGAGAVIVGKTNVPPMLADWQSANPVYGRSNHPLDAGRTPGGSSGGSAAALAAGMIPLELGSDIGGSIRVPSHFCGVFGHKPSYGLVPNRGHEPPGVDGVAPVLGVVGPMARSAEDLALALGVLAGPEGDEAKGYRAHLPPPRHAALADYRVLILEHHPQAPVEADILAAIEKVGGALEAAGARVSRRSALLPDLEASHRTYITLLMTALWRGPTAPPNVISAHAWLDALDAQLAIRRRWATLFEAFDVVLAPVLGVTAFPHDDEPDWQKRHLVVDGRQVPFGDQIAWPGIALLANLPATAVPVGADSGGMPIGLQVIGPYLEGSVAKTCGVFDLHRLM